MNLFELCLLLIIGFASLQFWRLRGIAEQARKYLYQYCQKNQIQLLSVAREKTRFGSYRGKLDWQCQFSFEFSGNGLEKQTGKLLMAGRQVIDTQLPTYKIN